MASAAVPHPGDSWLLRARQRARAVAEAAVTPLELDDVLDLFQPLRRGADLRARVVEVRPETATSATIVLQPGRDWTGHLPGQYVSLGVDVDGVRLWRTYSLTHGLEAGGRISVTVKAIEGGVVSHHLVHRLRAGTMVQLGQAQGDFVLPDPLPAKLLLVTAGSGITPVIGMLRSLFSRAEPARSEGRPLDVVLLHSATHHDDVIFGRELREYHARGLIRLIERHTDTEGMLDVTDPDAGLLTAVPDLADRVTYACGPVGLLDALERHHGEAGLPLHLERFRPAVVTPGEGGSVTFATGDREVEVDDADGATPLLDVGESAGVLMPSGCRMGVCFGCVVPLREGAVRDLRNGQLTVAVAGETGPEGVPVQTCINAAAGPCRLSV